MLNRQQIDLDYVSVHIYTICSSYIQVIVQCAHPSVDARAVQTIIFLYATYELTNLLYQARMRYACMHPGKSSPSCVHVTGQQRKS